MCYAARKPPSSGSRVTWPPQTRNAAAPAGAPPWPAVSGSRPTDHRAGSRGNVAETYPDLNDVPLSHACAGREGIAAAVASPAYPRPQTTPSSASSPKSLARPGPALPPNDNAPKCLAPAGGGSPKPHPERPIQKAAYSKPARVGANGKPAQTWPPTWQTDATPPPRPSAIETSVPPW